MESKPEFGEDGPASSDNFMSLLLGAICIGVSWIFALFVPVEFNFANPHDIFGQFSLRWAMFFVLFGGITLYILRQRETSTGCACLRLTSLERKESVGLNVHAEKHKKLTKFREHLPQWC